MKIGIDIMGGDYAPEKTISGAVLALKTLPKNTNLVLFGKKDEILNELDNHSFNEKKIEIVDCSEIINMNEHATKSLRVKPNSSIAKGFAYLAKKKN